jgi:two-component system sensor histidine kinase QseC
VKLLNRTIYYLITTMLFVFFIGSMIFYGILKSSTEKKINNELASMMEFIVDEIKNKPENYGNFHIPGYITIELIEPEKIQATTTMDTLLINPGEKAYKLYRTLRSDVEVNSEVYRVSVYKSLIESNELIERIILIATIILILFILFLYLLNRFIFGRVWSDFFTTLEKLRSYDVNSVKNIEFGESEIAEFKLLNSALNQMMEKIRMDYENVKEFTGNISHEIQTPLSVIRLKCELLLQSSPLSSEQALLIRDIQNTNSRLSKLNKTLVLFTKIENNQFPLKETISLYEVVERHLEIFSSIAEVKAISINCQKQEDFLIEADPMLMDVLIVNLIKNGIVHNIESGILNIKIRKNEIFFSNTGQNSDLSDQNIFERYKKIGKNEDSFGLGLSLANNICELYNLKLVYLYKDGLHQFTLYKIG